MINEKYNLILFDFGLIKYVLPEPKFMEFYRSSPSEMNEISMKSNILTYGFTLAKIFNRNKEITIKDKSLSLSTEKNLSDNFNNFLKKCLKKNKLKRYCYRDFPLDPFILNNSNENEALLTSSMLDSIISTLENKFESILSYYEEIITKIKNIEFLNMIQLFLIMSSKELEIIHKIFSKIEKKNDKFELNEEISFIQIMNNSKSDLVTFNLSLINDLNKLFSQNQNEKITFFIKKVESYINSFKNLIIKFDIKINIEDTNSLIKILFENIFGISDENNINKYFYNLVTEGMEYFDEKNFKFSSKYFEIAELLSEYIILVQLFLSNNVDSINNFKLLNQIFSSDNHEIEITTKGIEEEKEKYLIISFFGGLLRNFLNQLYKEEKIKFDNLDNTNYNTVIEFYPQLMKFIVDSNINISK